MSTVMGVLIYVRYMPKGVVTGEDVDCRSRIYHKSLALG